MESKHGNPMIVNLHLHEQLDELREVNAALLAVLKAITRDLQTKIDEDDNPIGRYVSSEYWDRACALIVKIEGAKT